MIADQEGYMSRAFFASNSIRRRRPPYAQPARPASQCLLTNVFQVAQDLYRASRCDLPALRKGFRDRPLPRTNRESWVPIALTIVAALELPQMCELEAVAASLGMAVLVEVHDGWLDLALSSRR